VYNFKDRTCSCIDGKKRDLKLFLNKKNKAYAWHCDSCVNVTELNFELANEDEIREYQDQVKTKWPSLQAPASKKTPSKTTKNTTTKTKTNSAKKTTKKPTSKKITKKTDKKSTKKTSKKAKKTTKKTRKKKKTTKKST
jgi:hypothetical protein